MYWSEFDDFIKPHKDTNQTFYLKLFGGRIDSIKYALRLAISHFERTGQNDMTGIYREMLTEVEQYK